jgi:hypothetical protein
MAELHVISALVTKYRELSGRLAACEREATGLRDDLSHIDAAIRVFQSDYDLSAIRPKQQYKRNPALKKGEMVRGAYDVLREAGEPLTALEIVTRVLAARGIEPSKAELQNARNSVGTCLRKKQREGTVAADGDHPKRWRLVSLNDS